MIIIAGTIDLADPSKIDEAIEKARPLQQATRDDEPGCHAYVFSPDPCVAGRIAVYELWEDEASLAAHFQHTPALRSTQSRRRHKRRRWRRRKDQGLGTAMALRRGARATG